MTKWPSQCFPVKPLVMTGARGHGQCSQSRIWMSVSGGSWHKSNTEHTEVDALGFQTRCSFISILQILGLLMIAS